MIRSSTREILPAIGAAAVLLVGGTAGKAEDGIFARFHTSMGDFSARLEHEKVPRTVANFVGLIEGSLAYVDLPTGRVRSGQFYDGILFHRVIEGFMNQSGSPAGTGSDGPGYQFEDEFHPSLRHESHVLSMANSGPDTNGSQFFVTVAPQPHLDDKHSVFGHITEGQDVVDAINLVATTDDRPDEDVVIESLRIDRVGEAALAFAVGNQGLPVVTAIPLRIETRGRLHLAARSGEVIRLSDSIDLRSWSAIDLPGLGYQDASSPLTLEPPLAADRERYFTASSVLYPPPHLAVASMAKRTLILATEAEPSQTLTYRFDEIGGGTAQLDDNPESTIASFSYSATTNALARMTVSAQGIRGLFLVNLRFTEDGEGAFDAEIYDRGLFGQLVLVGRLAGGFALGES